MNPLDPLQLRTSLMLSIATAFGIAFMTIVALGA